jgi:hypothetical protein
MATAKVTRLFDRLTSLADGQKLHGDALSEGVEGLVRRENLSAEEGANDLRGLWEKERERHNSTDAHAYLIVAVAIEKGLR